ncbi:MAG: metallophosphoesterase [Gammaproteobacteria bacterium]|nr:metallophosphoesterase [Gammaproteobacteria bacterium]
MQSLLNLGEMSQSMLIFGGPYSNLQATIAMQEIALQERIPPENIVCTGDIVAYCADPEQTTNLIREWGINVVMGNCEESIGFSSNNCGCGFEEGSVCATLSVDWYNYCLREIGTKNQLWMQRLPRRIQFTVNQLSFDVIHGGVSNISEFIFESSDLAKKYSDISSLSTHCIIGGHSGIPFGQTVRDRYWLNAGVIGMPANDGQQNGWYMRLEPTGDGAIASWHTLNFDNASAAASMKTMGLPSEYQTSLINGLWPSLSVLPDLEAGRQGMTLHPEPLKIQRNWSPGLQPNASDTAHFPLR